jgi:type VI secretion system protein
LASRGFLARVGAESGRGETVVESIVSHLNVLLNSREGECVTVPDFGIPDFTDLVHSLAKSKDTLAQTIQAAIEKYERRIEAVSVRYVEDGDLLVMRFEITGRVSKDRSALRLRTSVNPGGYVRVSR